MRQDVGSAKGQPFYKEGHGEDDTDCPGEDSYSDLANDSVGEDGSIV